MLMHWILLRHSLCIYAIYRLIKQRGQTSDQMLKNAIAYAKICAIYANFSICGVFSEYAILKMPLYAEKYAICTFCQNMRSHMRRVWTLYSCLLVILNVFMLIPLNAPWTPTNRFCRVILPAKCHECNVAYYLLPYAHLVRCRLRVGLQEIWANAHETRESL